MICKCGCGQTPPLATKTHRSRGWIKGQPLRFIHGHNTALRSPFRSLAERHAFYVQMADGDACYVWTGTKNPKGYGVLGVGSRTDGTRRVVLAHRLAWELVKGPIQPGLDALHSCDNPPCVRFSHLFLGTQADNMADMANKGRGRGRLSA